MGKTHQKVGHLFQTSFFRLGKFLNISTSFLFPIYKIFSLITELNIQLDLLHKQCNDSHFEACHVGIDEYPFIILIEDVEAGRYFLRVAVPHIGQRFFHSGPFYLCF